MEVLGSMGEVLGRQLGGNRKQRKSALAGHLRPCRPSGPPPAKSGSFHLALGGSPETLKGSGRPWPGGETTQKFGFWGAWSRKPVAAGGLDLGASGELTLLQVCYGARPEACPRRNRVMVSSFKSNSKIEILRRDP